MFKKSLILATLSLLVFFVRPVNAQGTYSCLLDVSSSVFECVVNPNTYSCDTENGYSVDPEHPCNSPCPEDDVFNCVDVSGEDDDSQNNQGGEDNLVYYTCNAGSGQAFCSPCDPEETVECYGFENLQECSDNCLGFGFKFDCVNQQCVPASSGGQYTNFSACQMDCIADYEFIVPTCPNLGDPGLFTALGCINFGSIEIFTAEIMSRLVGVGGGIAVLLISYAAILYMSSGGNPQKLSQSKAMVLGAVAGLLVLSSVILVFRIIALGLLNLF